MKKERSTYSFLSQVSGIFMILALFWLTISTPFIYTNQKAELKSAVSAFQGMEENNPLSNTEEKTESGSSNPSEYLHFISLMEPHTGTISKLFKCHSSDLYFAFHPELLSPPPEV